MQAECGMQEFPGLLIMLEVWPDLVTSNQNRSSQVGNLETESLPQRFIRSELLQPLVHSRDLTPLSL